MKGLVLASFALFFVLVSFNLVSANVYSIPYYVSNQTVMAKNPTFSIPSISASELTLKMRCNGYVSGAGDSICSYYAPLGSLIATGESSLYGNCVNLGEYSYDNTQSIYDIESSYYLTSSAGSFYTKVVTELQISTSDDYLVFSQNSTKDDLSHVKNFLSNSSYVLLVSNFPNWKTSMFNMYNSVHECADFELQPERLRSQSWGCDGGGTAAWRTFYFMRMFPFNSSETGSIRYNISKAANTCTVPAGGSCSLGYEIGYFEKGQSPTVITTGLSAAGSLTLNPNAHYVFYTASYASGKGPGTGVWPACILTEGDYQSEFNITIITPDWNCSEWSECFNGTEYRLCNDLTEKTVDKLETRFCYTAPTYQIYLGFEDYVTEDVWFAYNWGAVLCPCTLDVRERLYPDGWYVNSANYKNVITGVTARKDDFVDMSDRYAFEGFKSLKLWYLPPQVKMPDGTNCTYNNVTDTVDCTTGMGCFNTSRGIYADVRKEFNESVFIERNITLPTPFMSISLKVRKCVEPALKHPSAPLCFDFDNHCYTHDEDCNEEVFGRISVFLRNGTATASGIPFSMEDTSVVRYPNQWEVRDYAIDSLVPNQTYTLGIGIVPPDLDLDPNFYCVYVDDVNIDIRTQPFICESDCDGSTWVERTCSEYVGDVCVVCEQIRYSQSINCIDNDEVIEKVLSCEAYCGCEIYDEGHSDYYTRYAAELIPDCNISIYGYEECCDWTTEIENSEYCVNFCAQQEEGQTLFDPLNIVTDYVDEEQLAEMGLDWTLMFLTPIFIIFIIITIIAGFVGAKTAWQMGLVTMILGMIIIGVMFPVLIWISLVFTILAGFILARTFVDQLTGGK